MPNSYYGVAIESGASNNTIGYNVISGNLGAGVEIDASNSNLLQGNGIGLDSTGSVAVPNAVLKPEGAPSLLMA